MVTLITAKPPFIKGERWHSHTHRVVGQCLHCVDPRPFSSACYWRGLSLCHRFQRHKRTFGDVLFVLFQTHRFCLFACFFFFPSNINLLDFKLNILFWKLKGTHRCCRTAHTLFPFQLPQVCDPIFFLQPLLDLMSWVVHHGSAVKGTCLHLLKDSMLFSALCVSLSHALCQEFPICALNPAYPFVFWTTLN